MNQVKYSLALNKLNQSPLKPVIMDPAKAVNITDETKKGMRIYGQVSNLSIIIIIEDLLTYTRNQINNYS